MNCAFYSAIKFEFPSTAITEQDKVDWGRGHVHVDNRPIGSIYSEMQPGGNGLFVRGFTNFGRPSIHNYSAKIPGAVTQKLRLTVIPQPSPSDRNGRVLQWVMSEENGWLRDHSDTTGATIELPIAIFAEVPVNPFTKVIDGGHYFTCEGCASDHAAHPEQFWGTENFSDLINAITTTYDQLYFVTYSKHATASISRVSLQYGGIFDSDLSWTDAEPTHRFGKAFDISILYVDATVDHIDEKFLEQVQIQLARSAGFDYSLPSLNHPGYHFE